MQTHYSLHIKLIDILHGEIARLRDQMGFKSGKLSHCLLFIDRLVFHSCSFLLKAVILPWSGRR